MNITDRALDFTGMFWVVGSNDNRFLGAVKYRFGEPIELTFTIVDELVLSGTIDLHGVLSNGKSCSLIEVGFQKKDRPIDGRFTVYCQYFLIGHHQTTETEYTKWVFRFSGMMEFF